MTDYKKFHNDFMAAFEEMVVDDRQISGCDAVDWISEKVHELRQTEVAKQPKRYLVIGVYEDDNQRWAEDFEAETAKQAEAMAPYGVTVAGVVVLNDKGEMEVVA